MEKIVRNSQNLSKDGVEKVLPWQQMIPFTQNAKHGLTLTENDHQ